MNDQNTITSVIVPPKDQGMRLDAFLAMALGQSRAQVSKLIKDGMVLIQGRCTKPSYAVQPADAFSIEHPQKKPSSMIAENIALDILWSDEHIAVINKPRGMVVHPGAGVAHGTLCHALLYHFPEMTIGNTERPGIVHRLDRDTSGVMVVAKTQTAHQILSEDFKQRRVKKIYRAFCHGVFRKNAISLITGHKRHPHNRLRFSTKLAPPTKASFGVRLAHTDFVVKKQAFGISELECILHTGRTHQIRAHLADIGHPLVADVLYGGVRNLSATYPHDLVELVHHLPGQALHAEALHLVHPISQEPLVFTAPLPKALAALSAYL